MSDDLTKAEATKAEATKAEPTPERQASELAALSMRERELVALVDARRDLADADLRAQIEDDDDLGAALAAMRDERDAISMALKRAQPELGGLDGDDVSDLVMRAMAKADGPDVIRISPRSLGWGAIAGGLAVVTSACAWIAFQETMTAPISNASENVRLAFSLGATFDRIVALMPGGWTSIAAVAFGIGAFLLVCLRWIEHGKRIAFPAAAALALFTLFGAGRAQAYDVEGHWPSPDPRVDVDIEAQPLPVALEAATRSVNLGLVYGLADTRPVTLHAHGVPLREVLDAMLGGTPATVRHTGHMIVVSAPPASGAPRSATPSAAVAPGAPIVSDLSVVGPSAPMAPVAPVAPVAPTAPIAPILPMAPVPLSVPVVVGPMMPMVPTAPPSPVGRIDDVLTFGGDANIPQGHDVRDVVTMGGDAEVDGRAFGNVVTMGGDADIGGVVVGNVATMGGDIHIRPTGVVFGRLETMGGEVVHEGTTSLSMQGSADFGGGDAHGDGGGFFATVVETAEAGLRYALLFLGALVFAFFAPERFARLHGAVRRAPLRSIAGGTVALIASGLLSFVLLITIIGIPVALVLGLVVFVGACAGLATVGHLIGQALPVRALEERPVMRLAAGILALFVVTRVPFFGWLAFLVALAIGMGAVVLTRFGKSDVDVDP